MVISKKPDVLITGADWRGTGIAGSECVLANGGRVEYIEYISGLSSTNIINTLEKYKKSRSTRKSPKVVTK